MKVLTVKQPWSELICLGIKDVENRSWRCPKKFIGERVLIHASGTTAKEPYMLFNDAQAQAIDSVIMDVMASYDIKSAIIGSVEIAECIRTSRSIWAEDDRYHWIMRNPILFDKPILNVKGRLGFWDFDLYQKNEE